MRILSTIFSSANVSSIGFSVVPTSVIVPVAAYSASPFTNPSPLTVTVSSVNGFPSNTLDAVADSRMTFLLVISYVFFTVPS